MPNETPQQRIQRIRQQVQSAPAQATLQPATDVQQRIAEIRAKTGIQQPQAQPEQKSEGFLKGLAREVTQPVARLAANVAMIKNLGESLVTGPEGEDAQKAEQIRTQGLDLPFFGNVKPIGVSGQGEGLAGFGRDVADVAGVGTELASSVIPVGRAPALVSKLGLGKIGRGVIEGAQTGGIGGSLFGIGREAQQPESSISSIAGSGLTGAGLGAVGGAGLGFIGGGIGKFFAAKRFANDPKPELANELTEFIKGKRSLEQKVSSISGNKNTDVIDIISNPEVFRGMRVINGSLDTGQAVSTLQNQTDLLMDANRSILPEFEKLSVPISADEIRNLAIQQLDNITPAQRKRVINQINREFTELPDTMSLTELDKLRAQARNSARDAKGAQKDANAFAALENAAREKVFEVSEKVAQRFDTDASKAFVTLRDTIKNNINTIEFLQRTLQGQKTPGGRLGVMFGKGIGAIAGAKTGPLGALLTSEIGGIVARIAMNNRLGSAMRIKLIRNITDDSKILAAAEQLIQQVKGFNPLSVPALPSPAIQLPGRTTESSVRAIKASRGLPGRRPKGQPGGGRMFRTFKSN